MTKLVTPRLAEGQECSYYINSQKSSAETMSIYRGFDRKQLDSLYNNTIACGNWDTLYPEFKERSKKYRQSVEGQWDIAYSDAPRARFDFIPCGVANAPTYIFIHGGYWQHCDKEDFSFIAAGITQAGFNVIFPEYTEAPQATMTQIVHEIGIFLDFLQRNDQAYKIVPGKVVLSGHSAGGHLTAVHRGHSLVSHTMPISALVDLYPISLTWLNDKLRLTDKEIEAFSPIRHVRDGVPTLVVNGSSELLELVRHSVEYAEAVMTTKSKLFYKQTPDANHFTQLKDFVDKNGFLNKALQELIQE